MNEALTIALIALATHRITRLIVKDRIVEPIRLRLQLFFETRWERRTARSSDDTWGSATAYLLSCSWCTGIYVATLVTIITSTVTTVPLPVLTALTASTVTGIVEQVLPDD